MLIIEKKNVRNMNLYDKITLCVVSNFGAGVFTSKELLDKMEQDFPNVSKTSILPADCCVNRFASLSGGLSEDRCFLYAISDGIFRLFDPQRDSKNKIPKRN